MSSVFVRPVEIFQNIARHKPTRPKPRPRPQPKPSDSWPAWTDSDRWTVTSDPGPICSPDTTPSLASEAWACGFHVGYSHDTDGIPSADLPEALHLSWWEGRNRGWLNREYDDLTIDRLTDEANEPRETDGYPAGYTS